MADVLLRPGALEARPGPDPATVIPPVAERASNENLHRIVVVGGGAAGLVLATRLGDRVGRRGRAHITLVDCARTHIWKPLLHEVAAGAMDPAAYEVDYLAQAHWHGFHYRFGEMIGLDRARKEVRSGATFDDEGRQVTPLRTIGYDTLVIAIGSVTNDFGTPGVAVHAVPLETPEQAARFNRRLLDAFLRAQTQPGPVRPGQLRVAIVGAGATGTELAAELHRTARDVVVYGLDRIDPERDIRIVLIEAGDRVLPGLPDRISKATRVKAPSVLRELDGLEFNRINQLAVTPALQTTHPSIFAMGDCAACPRPGERSLVPPRAQAAHQEAAHMVRQIERRQRGAPLLPYTYRDFGSLVSLGRWSTVGNLMGFVRGRSLFIEGFFARMMYGSLRLMHERALHGTARTLSGVLARAGAANRAAREAPLRINAIRIRHRVSGRIIPEGEAA